MSVGVRFIIPKRSSSFAELVDLNTFIPTQIYKLLMSSSFAELVDLNYFPAI